MDLVAYPVRMKKLLVPVDGSGAALRALDQAIALAQRSPGCSIVLIHAHEEPLIYGEIAVYVPRTKMAELQRQHSEDMLVTAKTKLKDTGIPYTVEVLVGPIAQTIAEHAEHIGCDAIVMGRHGKSTLGDILVGSVAIKVLHASKLPVMLVR
jgi:nucleotide-binding universal stress UspA family protein